MLLTIQYAQNQPVSRSQSKLSSDHSIIDPAKEYLQKYRGNQSGLAIIKVHSDVCPASNDEDAWTLISKTIAIIYFPMFWYVHVVLSQESRERLHWIGANRILRKSSQLELRRYVILLGMLFSHPSTSEFWHFAFDFDRILRRNFRCGKWRDCKVCCQGTLCTHKFWFYIVYSPMPLIWHFLCLRAVGVIIAATWLWRHHCSSVVMAASLQRRHCCTRVSLQWHYCCSILAALHKRYHIYIIVSNVPSHCK